MAMVRGRYRDAELLCDLRVSHAAGAQRADFREPVR